MAVTKHWLLSVIGVLTLLPAWGQNNTLVRDIEEVVIEAQTGGPFGDFIGYPTDQIHLYRYDPMAPDGFAPIPFQIDRRKSVDLGANCTGDPPPLTNCETGYAFTPSGDPEPGNLQPGDEIVFLAGDAGPRAPNTIMWKQGGGTAVSDIRYEIEVQDKSSGQIVGQGWVYAFLFLGPHPYEGGSHTQWSQNAQEDPDRPGQRCQWGDPNAARGQKACGWFKATGLPPSRNSQPKANYWKRYLGTWIINRFYITPPGSPTPYGELVDRRKFRAYGQGGETEVTWSTVGCARLLMVKPGPVRTILYIQGAASGPATTRVDWLYPGHVRSRVKLRVHAGVTNIMGYADYLNSIVPSGIFVQSGSSTTPADVINGTPPASTFGQWEDWTQVNTPFGRVVYFFKETRPMNASPPQYWYEDNSARTNTPEFEPGAFGNHGELWPGPTSDLQDRQCDISNPDDERLRWRQFDETVFVAQETGQGPTADAQLFADWMARPLQNVINRQQRGVPIPPPPSPPTCTPSLTPSINPENGRYLDLQPTPGGCSDSTAGFSLYRALGNGAFSFLTTMKAGTVFRDWHVYRGQTYRYYARGMNTSGVEGPASSIVTMTAVDNEVPPAPTGLTVTAGNQTITVDWTDSTAWDLRGYNVYLSLTPGGPYTRANATLVSVPAHSFAATGLQNGTTYYGVVRAVDWGGNEGPNSVEVSATPGP